MPEQIVEKLHHFQKRLVRNALRTLALYETWNVLNTESSEREALVASPVTKAIGVMWEATQDRLVLLIMSALDEPGRGNIHGSDKISFPVFRALLDQPGVIDVLVADARSKNGAPKAEMEKAVTAAADRLRQRLDSLRHESPKRSQRLRSIRDRYLAHELHMSAPLDPPIFQNLRTMTEEILSMAEDATRVLAPTTIVWPYGDVAVQTENLVKMIALQYPLRG